MIHRILLLAVAILATSHLSAQAILGKTREGKYFLRSSFNHDMVTEAIFDNAKLVDNADTLVRVERNGRAGLISATGRTVVPLEYDQIYDAVPNGLSAGYVGAKRGQKFSLWHIQSGKKIIEGPYEYARAVWPDLLAARKTGSSVLDFFNEKGEKLFTLPGLSAWPVFDQNTFSIISEGGGAGEFYYKNGKKVFNETFKNGEWTDGTLVMVTERSAKHDLLRSGLVTMTGDTILPLDSVTIRHDCYQRFFVETITRPQKSGLYDAAKRSWIYPMLEQKLMKMGPASDSSGAIYSRRLVAPKGQFLYDAGGRQIAEGITLSTMRTARVFVDMFKGEHHPEKYIVTWKGSTQVGLLAHDGRQIVPMEYSSIDYAAETHPVIVQKSVRYADPNPVYNAYDLKTGQKLFAQDYHELLFTAHPRRFIARKNELYGILEVGKEAEARFVFDRLSAFCKSTTAVFSNFLFWARKDGKNHIISPDGSLNPNLVFDEIYLPDPVNGHYEKFKSQNHTGARLVAFGRRREQPKGYFYVDERGGVTFIADPTLGEMPIPDEGPGGEKVMDAPVAEEPDSRPPLVEKPFNVSVTRMPVFPGGEEGMLRFYKKKMKYPAAARKKRVEGDVFVEAQIDTDGSIKARGLLNDIGEDCGKEALRLVNAMPKWQPAELYGQAIALNVKICVPFQLD